MQICPELCGPLGTGEETAGTVPGGGGKELYSLLTQIQKITDTKVQKIQPPPSTLHPSFPTYHLTWKMNTQGGGGSLNFK